MKTNNQYSTPGQAATKSGLKQREPLTNDTRNTTKSGNPKGIPEKTVKHQNSKKKFTIC